MNREERIDCIVKRITNMLDIDGAETILYSILNEYFPHDPEILKVTIYIPEMEPDQESIDNT